MCRVLNLNTQPEIVFGTFLKSCILKAVELFSSFRPALWVIKLIRWGALFAIFNTAMPMRTCRNLLNERIFTTLHSSLELSRLKTKSEPTQRSYLRCLHASKTFTLIQFSEQTVSHFSQLVTPYCAKPWSCLNISWLL